MSIQPTTKKGKKRVSISKKGGEVKQITLAEFIKQDMTRRHKSLRQYAEFIDCAPSTVGEYLHGREATIEFLRKLARVTDLNLRDLLIIAYPEVGTPDDIDPQLKVIFARYKTLPKSVQDFILRAMNMMEK